MSRLNYEEIHALEELLSCCKAEEEKSQGGYFNPGWAVTILNALLVRCRQEMDAESLLLLQEKEVKMGESWKETPECFGKMGEEKWPCVECETDIASRCYMVSAQAQLKALQPPSLGTSSAPSLSLLMPKYRSQDEAVLERLKIWLTPEMPTAAWNTLLALTAVGFSRPEAFQILSLLFQP